MNFSILFSVTIIQIYAKWVEFVSTLYTNFHKWIQLPLPASFAVSHSTPFINGSSHPGLCTITFWSSIFAYLLFLTWHLLSVWWIALYPFSVALIVTKFCTNLRTTHHMLLIIMQWHWILVQKFIVQKVHLFLPPLSFLVPLLLSPFTCTATTIFYGLQCYSL